MVAENSGARAAGDGAAGPTQSPEVREILSQIVGDPRYPEVAHIPVISWPQLGLVALSLGSFALATVGYLQGVLPLWLTWIVNIAAVYVAFTPLHDACHRAVSSQHFLNDAAGILVGQLLLPGVNMPVFRAIHLDHHRFTGAYGRDPDTGLVELPKWLGVSYLLFVDLHWVAWYLKHARNRWPKRVGWYLALMLAMLGGVHALFLASPYWHEFLLLFVVPQRLGIAVTAYSFAHIQHPEGLTWQREPFQSTVSIRGNRWLRRLLLGQEDHCAHHLLPHVPWFKYKRVWDLANSAMRQQKIPQRGWIAPVQALELPHPADSAPRPVVVAQVIEIAPGIKAFALKPPTGQVLPPTSAGAHISVHLPSGRVRQYSLVNAPGQPDAYQIAVRRNDAGKGGSVEMHEAVVAGTALRIGRPRNNFLLYETASRYRLIAGGIGITPLLAMAHRLHALGKPFELHVCARSDNDLIFKDVLLGGPFARGVRIHLDGPDGKTTLDVAAALGTPDAAALVYVCGPQGFMDAVADAATACGWPRANIRTESFSAAESTDSTNRAFTVQLAKSGRDVRVAADQSVIDALSRSGVPVEFACLQGTCGTCVTGVREGEVEHRDVFLSAQEKATNREMCLCVSRAKSDKLVLEL